MKKLLLITTALAVGFAGPAHADPVTAIATVISGFTGLGLATAAALTQFGIGLGLSALSSALYKPKLPGANVSFDVKMGDDLPLSFVAGESATAGKRKYIGSWGENTRFITEVIEYSALPQGLDGIWINDERGNPHEGWFSYVDPLSQTLGPDRTRGITEHQSLQGNGIYVGVPYENFGRTSSPNDSRIFVKVIDGTQAAADPLLLWAFGDDGAYPWTAQHVGRGKSYVVITSLFDDETLTTYPTFLLEPAPLPLYDWRFDSTNGGSGPQRWGNRATYQPTLNPAVISYNIVRGIYYGDEWVYGGKNLPAWRLPVAEWSAAANACDQDINLAVGGVQPRYRCGLEISVDMEPASVLDEIGKSANMKFCEVGGRLKPIVDLPGAAVFAFTDGDILITEGQSFSPFLPASDTFNIMGATYPEQGEKWATKDAPEYADEEAIADDGGQRLPTSMSYGAVPFGNQVQRLMRSQMRDYRRMRRHQFYLPPDAYALEPGIDMVSWTSDRNGYINKQFMVESVSKTPGMNVLVSLREVDPSDYDWSSDFERPIVITPPVNPRPFVQPIRGLAVLGTSIQDAAGEPRRPAILVACDGDERGVTHIQIEARRVGTTQTIIDTERPFAEPHSWYLLNVLPSTAYEVRARLISDLTPRSAWSSWLTATTPDVRLGGNDVRFDEIADEVREDLGDLIDWVDGTGEVIRSVRDEIDAIRDLSVVAEFGNQLARDGIRREVAVEVGAARAAFNEQIDVVVYELGAQATRTTTLQTVFENSIAGVREEIVVATGPTSALALQIDGVSASIDDTVAEATSALVSRVSVVERVAGTDNRVWRQVPTPTGAAVTNGDYWLKTDTSQWHSRDSGAWVPIAANQVPPLLVEQTALSARLDEVSASIDGAVGEATDALVTRVTQIERVAGSNNRVWRQPTAPTSQAVSNGDYWQNTTTSLWFSRVSGSWVSIPTSSVPTLIIEQSVTSDAITQVTARTNRGTASGLLRATAASTPAGALARVALAAEASDGAVESTAALFLEARSDGQNQIIATANRFAIATGSGPAATRNVPFVVDGDTVYISNAFIQNAAITTAKIDSAAITNAKIGDLEVDRIKVANGSITGYERAFTAGSVTAGGDWTSAQQLSYTIGRSGPQVLNMTFTGAGPSDGESPRRIRVLRTNDGSTALVYAFFLPTGGAAQDFNLSFVDTAVLSGPVTYGMEFAGGSSGGGSGSPFTISNRFLGALNAYK